MEAILFLLTGVVLYAVSDWLLLRIEGYFGRTLEQRSLVFFAILLVLALVSFSLIRRLLGAG